MHCLHLQSGKTKFTLENATKTRIVLADTRVHILGSFQNIRVARCFVEAHYIISGVYDF